MKHVVTVTERETAEKLLHERLDRLCVDLSVAAVKVFLQVLITVLEHQRELVLAMQHVQQSDYVAMFELFEKTYLAKC